MICRLLRRRVCQHCDRPSRFGDRLVRRDGYRIHPSCIEHPASGFAKAVAL